MGTGPANRGTQPVLRSKGNKEEQIAASSDYLKGVLRHLENVGKGRMGKCFVLGVDDEGAPIGAYYVPGQKSDVALVVAGVHGSEQSGVEVAKVLLQKLARLKQPPHFTVVLVPKLLPSNFSRREEWEAKLVAKQTKTLKDGSEELAKLTPAEYTKERDRGGDKGRVTPGKGIDPNRQFPKLGKQLDIDRPIDSKGRVIEASNLALMALIKKFSPKRIVSIHAIKGLKKDKEGNYDAPKAGVYADPHPRAVMAKQKQIADEISRLARQIATRSKDEHVKQRAGEASELAGQADKGKLAGQMSDLAGGIARRPKNKDAAMDKAKQMRQLALKVVTRPEDQDLTQDMSKLGLEMADQASEEKQEERMRHLSHQIAKSPQDIAIDMEKVANLLTEDADQGNQTIRAEKMKDLANQVARTKADMDLAEELSTLALEMAKKAETGGARVSGNKLDTDTPNTLYPGQDPKKAAAQMRREDAKGVTLGQWGPSVDIGVITVEVAEQYGVGSPVDDPNRATEIEAHADAILEVFLGDPAKVRNP